MRLVSVSLRSGVSRILVIDDSDLIRRLAVVLLGRRPGWEIEAAESGRAGIARVAEIQPDAILLDLDMPELDGLATLERLRALPEAAGLPVALLTGSADRFSPEELRELGVAGVVAKPLSPATAADDVARALGWTT